MVKLQVVGKGGLYLLVKKGRLAGGAEAVNTLKELMQHVGTDTQLTFDPAAVLMFKNEVLGPS